MATSLFQRFGNQYEQLRKQQRAETERLRTGKLFQKYLGTATAPLKSRYRLPATTRRLTNSKPKDALATKKLVTPHVTAGHTQRERFKPPVINVTKVFEQIGSYTQGTPNPELLWNTITGQTTTDIMNTYVQALADPTSGQISLSVLGGNHFDAFGIVADSAPMPDRWVGGDAITTYGTETYIYDLPAGQKIGGKVLSVAATFYSPNDDWAPIANNADPTDALSGIYGCFSLEPGQPGSPGSGFVAATANIDLRVTLMSDSGIVTSGEDGLTVFQAGRTRSIPGGDNGEVNVLYQEWLLAKPGQSQALNVSLPYSEGIRQIAVDAEVSIGGYRMGVGDPHAGGVAIAFQADGTNHDFHYAPEFACPFIVTLVDAVVY